MKNHTIWLMTLALSTLMFSGCGKKTDDGGETAGGPETTPTAAGGAEVAAAKEITIWWAQWDPAVGLQEMGADFEKETGIKVNVHQIAWPDYQKQVFLEFGNPTTDFDVVVGDSQWIGLGATDKLYLDLSDWLPTAVDLKSVHPNALKYLCEYPAGSGKYYAAPCETDAVGFVYRKDWFEDPAEKAAFQAKYGRALAVPATWADFRDVAEFFTRPDDKRYGCALLTGRGYDSLVMGYQHFLWAYGGSWGDPTTRKAQGFVNTPGAAEGLGFMKSLLAFGPNGAENLDYVGTNDAFKNGSTAMAMDYFAFFPGIASEMGDKAGFFAIPTHNGKRHVSLGGQGFSISAKTSADKQAAAKQFIAWFLKEENQKKWITKPAGFTANTAILASDEFRNAAPYNAAFADSLDSMQDFWNVPVYNELLTAARDNLASALDGQAEPQAALDKLAKEHEAIMDDADLLK